MRHVYVAGNRLVQEDSLALKVAEELEGKLSEVEFKELSSLGELEEIPSDLYIIDVAKGLKKVEKIEDLSRLQQLKLVSLHDFDLGTELLLYKKLGKLNRVVLIAIPLGYGLEKAVEEVKAKLKSISP